MKIYPKMNKSNTVLVLIDIVNGCAHKKCEDPEIGIRFSKIRKMVPKLKRFISVYRKKVGSQIIFVNLTPWTKKYLPKNLQELYTDPKAEYYSDDDSGFSEAFYQVKPEKRDLIITKNTYDAFANPEFKKFLKKKKIQYLIMTGVFTDGCVLSTIANGFSAGFNFVILKDLIEGPDHPKRQQISKLLKGGIFPYLYGKTLTSKQFLDSWKKLH